MTKRQINIKIGESLSKSKLLCFCSCKGRLRCFQTYLRTVKRQEIDPITGRYIQSDPIGFDGGVNTYLYANANSLRFVDESGEVAHIEYYNNNVLIKLFIHFSGSGATREKINEFKRSIERVWSGKFGKYNVQTIVIEKPLYEADNIISIPNKNGRSYVMGVGGSSGTWYKNATGKTAAHEAGHLFGIKDYYKDDPISGYSKPLPGYENNIMASLSGYVDERNIKEIMLSSSNIFIQKDSTFVIKNSAGINLIMLIFNIFILLSISKKVKI